MEGGKVNKEKQPELREFSKTAKIQTGRQKDKTSNCETGSRRVDGCVQKREKQKETK